MTRDQIRSINDERLARWGNMLAEEHATPLLVIGIEHGARSGAMHLCMPQESDGVEQLFSRESLAAFLRQAADMLERRDPRVKER